MTQPRSLRFRLVASLIMVLGTLGALEALARTINPELPYWRNTSEKGVLLTGSDTRLWTMSPGTHHNGSTTVSINPLGLRGTLPTTPRPTQNRILIVGDSSFFGHGISDDQTIAINLENLLHQNNIDADVVNGAIPGYSTEQTQILLSEVGWNLDPTLLLIGNLWSDNNVDGFRDKDLLKTAQLRQSPLSWSGFYRLLSFSLDQVNDQTAPQVITWTRDSSWPQARQRRVPLQDYATNLDNIIREARNRSISTALIAPTNRGIVETGYPQGAGWDPYFDAQKQLAAHHHIPLISFAQALQSAPPAADKFVDLMHPSGLATPLIAQQILSDLTQSGWPQAPLLGQETPFDSSKLMDANHNRIAESPIQYSPQTRLFSHTDPTTPSPTPSTPTWTITGTLENCQFPAKITLYSSEKRPLGFVNLTQAEPFTLQGQGSSMTITVKTKDSQELSVKVSQGQSRIALSCD